MKCAIKPSEKERETYRERNIVQLDKRFVQLIAYLDNFLIILIEFNKYGTLFYYFYQYNLVSLQSDLILFLYFHIVHFYLNILLV